MIVALIGIAAELHRTVLVHPGGEIGHMDRNGRLEIDNALFALSDRAVDACPRPALVGEQEFGQVERILDPHTAMAENAQVLIEQALRWGVVQIDIEAVGKHELHFAQRILAARILAQ